MYLTREKCILYNKTLILYMRSLVALDVNWVYFMGKYFHHIFHILNISWVGVKYFENSSLQCKLVFNQNKTDC